MDDIQEKQAETLAPEEEQDDRPVIGKCYICGEDIREGDAYETDCEDNKYCEDCECERVYCDHCGEYFHPNTSLRRVRVDSLTRECWCDDCCYDDAVECDDCGELVACDYAHGDDNTTVCNYCYDDRWTTCSDCGCLISSDDAHWRNDEPYCEDCLPQNSNILDYCYQPRPVFFGDREKSEGLFMGFELEAGCLDCAYDADETAGEVTNAHCYCKEDCSIDEYGFELVSHPHTLQAHKEAHWDDALATMRRAGMKSHDAEHCGLHVHVSREFMSNFLWDIVADFMDRFKEQFIALARRHSDYANFPSDGCGRRGRYSALNLTNDSTVEFRIFRGTLKYETLMATLELVDATCRVIKDAVYDMPTWVQFCDYVLAHADIYGELIAYMKRRNVWCELNDDAVTEPAADEEEC